MNDLNPMHSDGNQDPASKTINRGWLKHGNPPGDPSKAPRCGARRKYDGQPCQAPGMKNGRCRLHGGKSTGPRWVILLREVKKLAIIKTEQQRMVKEAMENVDELIADREAYKEFMKEMKLFDRMIEYMKEHVKELASWRTT